MPRRVRTEKEQYNAYLVRWGKGRSMDFRQQFSLLGINPGVNTELVHSGYGKNTYGEINRISFYMPKVMVYIQKGVGRGWPIHKVGTAGALAGGKGRVPKDWFNGPVSKAYPELVETIVNFQADAIVNNILIR
jgi:hypothetical protein